MNTLSKKILVLSICVISLFWGLHFADDTPTVNAQDTEFLTPPYFGTKSVSVIFDHEYPTFGTHMTPEDIDGSFVHRDGFTYPEYVCTGYSGHTGIDYPMIYDYVLAAHGGTVIEAGWGQPENRRTGLGLRVGIQVTNSNGTYRTRYGHLSTLMVKANQFIAQGAVIAISGNTGNSGGPHLHFQVEKQHTNLIFYPVNPYGWESVNPNRPEDPWENADLPVGRPASDNLWKNPPSINRYSDCPVLMYDSGAPIDLPASPQPPLIPDLTNPVRLEIDDGSDRFSQFGTWHEVSGCLGLPACYGDGYRYLIRSTSGRNGYAMWSARVHDLVVGKYDVYAYIPNAHANTALAYYQIFHNNKIHSVGIDQSRFNQGSYTRVWAYLGRYEFSDGTDSSSRPQQVVAYNEGDDGQEMAADAVVLVLADGPPDLILNIAQGSDDASPKPECVFDVGYPEIYLGRCSNGNVIVSGFRYASVDVPANATVTRAHLKFTVDGTYTADTRLRFYGEYNPASATFSAASKPEDRQPLTDYFSWHAPPADVWVSGQIRYSPNLGPVVQEIVNHPGWQQGVSALTFIVQPDPAHTGLGRRVMAYERDQPPPPPPGTYSARLLLWYTCPGGPPCPTQ